MALGEPYVAKFGVFSFAFREECCINFQFCDKLRLAMRQKKVC